MVSLPIGRIMLTGFLILVVVQMSCYREVVVFDAMVSDDFTLPPVLAFDGRRCGFDAELKRLRYAIPAEQLGQAFSPHVRFQALSTIYFADQKLTNDTINALGPIELDRDYPVRIETQETTTDLLLSFTDLPIAQITTPHSIYDEPKTPARLTVNPVDDTVQPEEYFIGIEHRGGHSQFYDKKSFGFELRLQPVAADQTVSRSLLGLHINDAWILDAMFIDDARLRNRVSFDLWRAMGHEGIAGRFVELFVNNRFQGLYSLNETINAQRLNLTESDGVLYKTPFWASGSNRFFTYPSSPSNTERWDGWEQRWPDPAAEIRWKPVAELIDLVVHASDADFTAQIGTQIDLDNALDYYLLLNLAYAADNTGKNMFYLRRSDADPFRIIPWDFDGTWGIKWEGSPQPFDRLLTNRLFDRLIALNVGGFRDRLKERWFALRGDLFSSEALKDRFAGNFGRLSSSQVFELENERWSTNLNLWFEAEYLYGWLDERLLFLDEYVGRL